MAISRWIVPTALAASLAIGAFAASPAKAQAYDATHAVVGPARVVYRGNPPYDRGGTHQDQRVMVSRDAYGRPAYYGAAPAPHYDSRYTTGNTSGYRNDHAPYGNAYGYNGRQPVQQQVTCNKHGKCKAAYYDPRYGGDGHR